MKNFHSLDIVKVIAALFVIMIHLSPFEHGFWNDFVVLTFARLAVPFFYITSAFLFFLKSPQRINVVKYVHRMLILYGFWFIVQFPIIYIEQIHDKENKLLACGQICWNFITNGTFGGSYFIMALIIAVPLVYFISKKYQPLVWIVGIICYLLCSLCESYYYMMPSGVQDILRYIQIPFKDISCSFMPAILYVLLGKWCADHQDLTTRIKAIPYLLTIALLTSSLYFLEALLINEAGTIGYEGNVLRMPFTRVFAAFPLFLLILNTDIHNSLPYLQIRRLSTIMFFSHFLFVFMVYRFYYHFAVLLHMNNLMLYLFVLTCSFVTFIFMDKASKTKKISWMKYGF